MSPSAPTEKLRQLVEDRLTQLVSDLEAWVQAEAGVRAAAARRALTGHLNQTIRMLRGAPDLAGAAAILADASGPFCAGAAVFRLSGGALRGERVRGVTEERAECFAALEVPLSAAGCFAQALDTGEPVVALGGVGDLSRALVELLAHTVDDRVCVFPIVAGGKPAGLLYAWGDVDMAALELLAQAAGMGLTGLRTRPAPAPAGLLDIAQAPSAAPVGPAAAAPPAPRTASEWQALPPVERDAHLRAQRFARVQVAEMRLYRSAAVNAGRARRDLYGELGDAIDAARQAYRRQFLDAIPGMTDYLHEELLHTLANDDKAMFGPKYPGPLA